jgi:hypothetical protein
MTKLRVAFRSFANTELTALLFDVFIYIKYCRQITVLNYTFLFSVNTIFVSSMKYLDLTQQNTRQEGN